MTLLCQPLGDQGVRLQFGDAISPDVNRAIRRFCLSLERQPIDGIVEWVPAYTTVAVYYRPARLGYESLCDALQQRAAELPQAHFPPPVVTEIPTCYGGPYGPDLEHVARSHGLEPAAVVHRHTRPAYLIYMLGFAPGFPYLGGLPEEIATPRLPEPRTSVPAGSVGIADRQTGIYPLETPGGWQIIGRTPVRLYDPARTPPVLLKAGDYVRFVAVTPEQYGDLERQAQGGACEVTRYAYTPD